MNFASRVPVLMYHQVDAKGTKADIRYCVAAARFAAHMQTLAASGYRAVNINAFVNWLCGGPPLAAGDFVLTFDDGYRGVFEHALPTLESFGWPATVFLVTDLMGGFDSWNTQEQQGKQAYPLLTPEEVREMQSRGHSFHSHTRTHVSLPPLSDGALNDQLVGSRMAAERLLGRPVDLLAYPYGHVDKRVETAARAAGYRAAFSVQPGFNRQDVNPFRIRRLDVFGTDTPSALLRKMRLGSNDGSLRSSWRDFLQQVLRTDR